MGRTPPKPVSPVKLWCVLLWCVLLTSPGLMTWENVNRESEQMEMLEYQYLHNTRNAYLKASIMSERYVCTI